MAFISSSDDEHSFIRGWDFDGSRGILSGSMGRVKKMLKSNKSNRRLMCYVILGVVVLVVLGYTLASRATRQ
ncbi:hypothetical protein MTO96_048490 [Rhipicephalus appendiculatus]